MQAKCSETSHPVLVSVACKYVRANTLCIQYQNSNIDKSLCLLFAFDYVHGGNYAVSCDLCKAWQHLKCNTGKCFTYHLNLLYYRYLSLYA